jgi:Concanavalin A-like lectin/glucanases superfamily
MSQRYTAYTNVTAAGFALDPSGGWSVCGWIYLVASSGGDGDLFYVEPTATPGSAYAIRLGYSHNGSDPTLRFRSGDGTNQLDHTEVVAVGQWFNMAITYDGTTARAYVDGVEVDSQTMTMSGSYDAMDMGDFAFGSSTVELAQIKVWEGHALSPSELATEIAYWQPQTATGDVYAWWQQEAADPTLDSSGNSHTLSGPGSANGSFTPPGQLNPTNPIVAAVGDTVSNGVAVVRQKLRVQASGNAVAGSVAWVRTNVAPEGGGASSFGGRSRKRRSRR